MTINELIRQVALKYIGQHEKPGNSGFHDRIFEAKMKEVGFSAGQAWCSYFSELVWKEAYLQYNPDIETTVLFSASATKTYQNFDISPDWEVSKVPVVGAVAIWRHGVGWQGHAGIVVEITKTGFKSVEGNTNSEGGREGVEVAIKGRKLDFSVKADRLNLIGFIIPRQ